MEECNLDHADRDTDVSIRQPGEELDVSHMTIWRVLYKYLPYPYHCNECSSSRLLIFQPKRNFLSVLFKEMLSNSVFHQWSSQMRHVLVEKTSSMFKTNTSEERRILMVFGISVWAGIVGDCLVDPHVLSLQPASKH
jgi:hypothetical protein